MLHFLCSLFLHLLLPFTFVIFKACCQIASSRFYRIISMYTNMIAISWFSRGSNSLMLTSVSFIVINSIRVVKEPYVDKCSEILWNSDTCNKDYIDTVSSGLISELTPCLNCETMRIRCRVSCIRAIYVFCIPSRLNLCLNKAPYFLSSSQWMDEVYSYHVDAGKWLPVICDGRLLPSMFWFWSRRIDSVMIYDWKLTPGPILLTFLLLVLCWVSYLHTSESIDVVYEINGPV